MLYVFVEGPDDERYFNKIYGACFQERFESYKIIKYAQWKKDKIDNFIKSIARMPDVDYIFFGDADGKNTEDKKQELTEIYKKLSPEKIFIVRYEIESWYYAGIDENQCRELKLKRYEYMTDDVTKEDFYNKLPNRPDRVMIMTKILDDYSIKLACLRNQSLRVFHEAMCPAV